MQKVRRPNLVRIDERSVTGRLDRGPARDVGRTTYVGSPNRGFPLEWSIQAASDSRIARHAETRRVEIGGFRTLAGAWADFRDWAMGSNPRLTIY